MNTCPKCGSNLKENAVFCGKCGYKREDVPSLRPQAAPAASLNNGADPVAPDAKGLSLLRLMFALTSGIQVSLAIMWLILPVLGYHMLGLTFSMTFSEAWLYIIFTEKEMEMLPLIIGFIPVCLMFASGARMDQYWRNDLEVKKFNFVPSYVLLAVSALYDIIIMIQAKEYSHSGMFGLGGTSNTFAGPTILVLTILSLCLVIACSVMYRKYTTANRK